VVATRDLKTTGQGRRNEDETSPYSDEGSHYMEVKFRVVEEMGQRSDEGTDPREVDLSLTMKIHSDEGFTTENNVRRRGRSSL
jgi:hypothetical protein